MGEPKPALPWERDNENDGWFLVAGDIIVRAWDDCGWRVSVLGHIVNEGDADSPCAGQLAAEAAAFAWLSEGVAAFGGRVLATKEQQAMVRMALRTHVGWLSDFESNDAEAAKFEALRRELEGAGHG